MWIFLVALYGFCNEPWWQQPVDEQKIRKAQKELSDWKPPRLGPENRLMALPHKGSTLIPYVRLAHDPKNNIYGYPRLHRVLLRAAKFVELLYGPKKQIPVLRINTTHPPSQSSETYAHANGISADLGYILKDDGVAESSIDLAAQFWLVYALFESAAHETELNNGVGWLATAYAEELRAYGRWLKKQRVLSGDMSWMNHITTDFDLYHVSHMHFGLKAEKKKAEKKK